MVCEKSRGTADPQQGPDLYGDQQREGEGPVAERKQGWGGSEDKPPPSTSVNVVTRACCCLPIFLLCHRCLGMGHCTPYLSATSLGVVLFH